MAAGIARRTFAVVADSTRWRSQKNSIVPTGSKSGILHLTLRYRGLIHCWVVGVSFGRCPVVPFRPLRIQLRARSYPLHQVRIRNVFAAESDHLSQSLTEKLLTSLRADINIEHQCA